MAQAAHRLEDDEAVVVGHALGQGGQVQQQIGQFH
jgi:hypothetical protein